MGGDETLNIIIKLKDEASEQIKKMTSGIGNALDSAKSASFAFGGALAAVGVGLYSTARAAADAEKVHKQLEAVLKSTGGAAGLLKEDIEAQATALSKLTNFEDEAILSGQNLLLTFTNIKGPVMQQATEAMLDMAAAMGTDAKGSAIQLGKALNDPINGISALTRVGVTFSDEQKQVIETLVKTGKTAEAQKVILAELSKEFGGSAKAQVDPIIQMKNAMGDAAEEIGTALLPIINAFAKALSHFATDVVPVLIEKIGKMVDFFKEHKVAMYALVGLIIGGLVPAVYAAVSAFAALALSLAPFLIAGAIIGGIVAGIVWIVENWEMISDKAKEIWGGIADFFIGIWDSITGAIEAAWDGIKSFFSALWDGIKVIFEFALGFIVGMVVAIFDALGIDIVKVFQKIADFFVSFWEGVKEVFNIAVAAIAETWNSVWQAMSDFLLPIWEAIKATALAGWNWLKTKFQEFTEPIRKAWNGLWDGLASGVNTAWESVKNTVKQSINWIIDKINVVINAINAVAQKGAKVIGFNAPQIPNIPMLAKGGIVNGPTLAMIGEAGPEAVVPLSKMGSMGMGGGTTVIINNPEFKSRDDETRLRNMLDDYFRPLMINHKIS